MSTEGGFHENPVAIAPDHRRCRRRRSGSFREVIPTKTERPGTTASVGLCRGGGVIKRELRLYFPKVQIKWGVLALFALAIQAIAVFAPLGLDDIPKRVLFVLSYLVLLIFIARNLPRPGIAIIGIGVLLNLLPIVANGGLMPVTAENLAKIDQTHRIEGRQDGDAIPHTKNVLKSKDNTRFYELSDRIVWDNSFFFRVFSAGDVVIAGGLVVTLGDLLLPRVKRETRRRESPSRVNP